jgi:hypothetical protein
VHELEHLLLLGEPLAVLGEENIRGKRRSRAAVVELEDQLTRGTPAMSGPLSKEEDAFGRLLLDYLAGESDDRLIFWV